MGHAVGMVEHSEAGKEALAMGNEILVSRKREWDPLTPRRCQCRKRSSFPPWQLSLVCLYFCLPRKTMKAYHGQTVEAKWVATPSESRARVV